MKDLDVLAVSIAQHDKEIAKVSRKLDGHLEDTHNYGDRIKRMEPIVNGNGRLPLAQRMASVEKYITKTEQKEDKRADRQQNWLYACALGIFIQVCIAARSSFF